MLVDTNYFDFLAGKTVLILGLGREGKSTYQFMRKYGPDSISFRLADAQPVANLTPWWRQEIAEHKLAFIQLGEQTVDWSSIDAVAVTPGISDRVLKNTYGAPATVPVLSNAGLYFELAESRSLYHLTTIGVTGTKGKSTTTAMIHHVLSECGLHAVLGGNIGVPPLDVLDQLITINFNQPQEQLYAVLELSSHQIARMHHSPQIAVVQAITPEHLDYYFRFDNYLQAKTGICRFQTKKDTTYFFAESENATEVAELSPGKKIKFSLKKSPIDPEKMSIPGMHNVLNAMPAILIAKQLGIQEKVALKKVYSFAGLPHRLQLVALGKTADGSGSIRFYDDSLSTTPEAAMAAMDSFEESVVLIAGGYDRGLEYAELGAFLARAALGHKLRGIVCFPPSGERIVEAMINYDPILVVPMVEVETMAEAVAEARMIAEPGDIVLLSPASASFGRFKDYADRGDQFAAEAKKTSSPRYTEP